MKAEQIDRLDDIISSKGWASFDYIAHPNMRTKEAISRMMFDLQEKEIDITLDLLEYYLIIKNYSLYARKLMLIINNLGVKKEIYLTPVIDYDSKRTKSGHSLHYEMANFSSIIESARPIFLDDPLRDECQKNQSMHVSVDDYIGTGRQFLRMIERIKEKGGRDTITHVAAVCIQNDAKLKLEAEGYAVLAVEVLDKGLKSLADRRAVPAADVYDEYDILEKKTLCSDNYKRGRDQCEALVTMKATPNNTLPIFWWEGSKKWPAPFPRPKR